MFPFAIAALAGASGGLWSWASVGARTPSAVRARAVLGGGWRMFLLALALSYAGLFVAGIVQPDEPVAARDAVDGSVLRYRVRAAWDGGGHPRPSPRALAERGDLDLRARRGRVRRGAGERALRTSCATARFPSFVASSGEVAFGNAPAGYLAFLLVPAIATIVGGRWAGSASGRSGAGSAAVGAAAGVVFAVVMLAAMRAVRRSRCRTAPTPGAVGRGGHLWIGPDPVTGTLFALAWGVVGGALGGATSGFRRWTAGADTSRMTTTALIAIPVMSIDRATLGVDVLVHEPGDQATDPAHEDREEPPGTAHPALAAPPAAPRRPATRASRAGWTRPRCPPPRSAAPTRRTRARPTATRRRSSGSARPDRDRPGGPRSRRSRARTRGGTSSPNG